MVTDLALILLRVVALRLSDVLANINQRNNVTVHALNIPTSISICAALETWGLERCSVSPGQLWIGLRPNSEYKRQPILKVPEQPQSVLFVEAPEQAELVEAFAASPEARGVVHLMIGTSHAVIRPDRRLPYDMSDAVGALAKGQLANLKRLSLGDMEKLFNGHSYFGKIGDITHIFKIAPALERLDLQGWFELPRPVRHACLRTLAVQVDEIGVSGGPLSQQTVSNLLMSELPQLRDCGLSLEADDAEPYAIPNAFFSTALPHLDAFDMDLLQPESAADLAQAKRGSQ